MTARLPRIVPAAVAGFALMFAAPTAFKPAFADSAASAILQNSMPSLAPILEKVTPAVVNVSVKSKAKFDMASMRNGQIPDELRRFFQAPGGGGGDEDEDQPHQPQQQRPQPRERTSMGSGVIIDAKKGYIMTNHHVVENASEILVTLKDRREYTAKLVGSDDGTDIAVLQIDAPNLSQLPIGDSSAMRVGDYVMAVGNPFGLGQTVTSGIVSALGRSNMNIEGYEDFIQTDASINPGNSGGALVNLKGELVGINTAIIGPSGGNVGIGFAVPTSMAKTVMTQLIKYGKIERGRIGVQIQDVTPDLAKNLGIDQVSGAVIGKIEKDSPADHAGLKTGDVVVAIDDRPVMSSSDLRNRVGLMPVGTHSTFVVVRDGSKKTINVTVGKSQEDKKLASTSDRPALEGATFSVTKSEKGVEVTDVERGSPAWQIGLRPKDVVVSVNRKPVKNTDEMGEALKASQRQAALFIKRGSEDLLIVV